jgi:RNA polymerase sigma-70 factor (ECF subfamily)
MVLNDRELIIKAQNGDAAAFEDLVYRYDRKVLSIALKYVNDRDDAKDIYQEVFIRVFKSLKNFQFRSEFSTWLYRIATNVCLTYRSRKKKRVMVSLDHDGDERTQNIEIPVDEDDKSMPEASISNNELKERIDKEVNKLSPKKKMIFVLKYYEGYKIREIAEMLRCKEGTVKKSLFDAAEKLKEQLKYLSEE